MVTRVIGVRIDGTQARRGALQVRRAMRDISKAGDRTRRSIRGVGRALFSLRSAFAALGVGLVGKSLLDTAVNLERVERGLKQATGSADNAAVAMRFISDQTDRLGLSLKSAETGFVGIAAAARGTSLEGEETRNIFLGISEASAALGLSAEQTKGALLAVEQIISKGKVSAEELRGQLGERLPGAFQIAARAIGVTTAQLDKFLVMGKLTAEDFIPLFARQLREEMGAAASEASTQLQGAMNKMATAVERLKRAIATSGALDPIKAAIVSITALIEDPAFLKGAAAAFRSLGNSMKIVADNIGLVVVALQALAVGVAASVFTRLAGGAVQFAVGLGTVGRAALVASAGLSGMARASAAATAGMKAMRTVGLVLGGPIGILVGIATAAILVWQHFRTATVATEDFKDSLRDLGKTPIELDTERIHEQISKVTLALAEAQAKRDKAQERIAEGPGIAGQFAGSEQSPFLMSGGAQAARFTGAAAAFKEATSDIELFERSLRILNDSLNDTGVASDAMTGDFETMKQALVDKLAGGSDEAEKAIKQLRESLEGMTASLQESVDTFGLSDAAILKYRLTTGDLKTAVEALGEEGAQLAEELIRLAGAYEGLETKGEKAAAVQEAFADIYDNTRTAAERYADELERLNLMQVALANSGALTAEQMAELPEIFDRMRQQAADMRDNTEDEFSAMTEFAIAAARSLQTAFSDFFFSVMQGEFDNMADNFKRTIDRMMADFLASQLLGMIGGFAGSGGVLGAIGTVVSGGKTAAAALHGGNVPGGQAVLVGESGPELFTPSENGQIIPNRSLAIFQARANLEVREPAAALVQGVAVEPSEARVAQATRDAAIEAFLPPETQGPPQAPALAPAQEAIQAPPQAAAQEAIQAAPRRVAQEPAEQITQAPAEQMIQAPAERPAEAPVRAIQAQAEQTIQTPARATQPPAQPPAQEQARAAQPPAQPPAQEQARAQAQEAIQAPAQDAITAPPARDAAQDALRVPAQDAMQAPAQPVIEAAEAIQVPAAEVIQAPAEVAIQATAERGIEAPAERSIEAPVEQAMERPAEQAIQAPAEQAIQAPAQEAAQEATAAPAREAAEEAMAAPAQEAIQASAQEAMQAPAQEATQAQEAIEAPAEQAIQAQAQQAIQAPPEQAIEAPARQAIQVPAEAAAPEPAQPRNAVQPIAAIEPPVESSDRATVQIRNTLATTATAPQSFTPPAIEAPAQNVSLGSFRARSALAGPEPAPVTEAPAVNLAQASIQASPRVNMADGMRGANVPISNSQQPTAMLRSMVAEGIDRINSDVGRLTTGRTKVNMLPGRQGGGPVFRGQPVVAGEAGPEMFVGSRGGGGGGDVNVQMTINATDADSFRQSQGQILAEMSRLLAGARARNG